MDAGGSGVAGQIRTPWWDHGDLRELEHRASELALLCASSTAEAKSVPRDGECPRATEPQRGSRCVRGVGVSAAGAHLDSDAGKRLGLG